MGPPPQDGQTCAQEYCCGGYGEASEIDREVKEIEDFHCEEVIGKVMTELGCLISDTCLDLVVEIIEPPDWTGSARIRRNKGGTRLGETVER